MPVIDRRRLRSDTSIVHDDPAKRDRSRSLRGGFTLLEMVAVLAVTTTVTLFATAALRGMADAAWLEVARLRVLLGLLEARRTAYLTDATTTVHVREGNARIEIEGPARTIELPREVRVSRAPRRGSVRFFASGLADNATIGIGAASGAGASVVVNQRGVVR